MLFPPDGIGCSQQPTTSHATTLVSRVELPAYELRGLCVPCTIKLLLCRIRPLIHDLLLSGTCHECWLEG